MMPRALSGKIRSWLVGLLCKEQGMLVLRRKVGESIIINHNVRVTVHQVIGNTIRLAIDAPKDVSVNREELELRIAAEGKDEE